MTVTPAASNGLVSLVATAKPLAAAIAAIAFGRRAVVVDANVERVVARVSRGKLDLTLRLRAPEGNGALQLNPRVVAQLSELALDLSSRMPNLRTGLTDLLQFPGVLQSKGVDMEALQAEALALLDAVLDQFVAAREREGAKLVIDGRGFKMQGYENGFYLGGSLFDNVTKDMRIYKEEIFGPVLSVVRAKDYHEALALPSDHDYGNGVAIFTRDGDAARDFAAKVNVGMVGVNVPIPVPIAYYTFGGWKKSGFGDLNQHGPDSVRF